MEKLSTKSTPLTIEMIKSKCKTEKLNQIKNINLWGNEISNLAVLRELPNLEIVSLSLNKVYSLKDLAECPKIQEVYLRKNVISDLKEVRHLSSLHSLKVLWLSHNPCSEHPYYRRYIIKMLPQLFKLDNDEVKPDERQEASRIDFEKVFKEHPSDGQLKSKRPSTPNVFQPTTSSAASNYRS